MLNFAALAAAAKPPRVALGAETRERLAAVVVVAKRADSQAAVAVAAAVVHCLLHQAVAEAVA